ncbi:MAG: hypothetical protein HKP61_13245 [Dactylosporangium sp.]|nr:hypothetical protein [Dactylosporangium sp.]NNJ61882.1 hypothetical protein [Dactylosporangium sp.]
MSTPPSGPTADRPEQRGKSESSSGVHEVSSDGAGRHDDGVGWAADSTGFQATAASAVNLGGARPRTMTIV